VTLERVLRAGALLIAVLAAIDPAWSRTAPVRPRVVVLHASEADRALAAQVAETLAPLFEVSRTDDISAAAYVIAGTDVREGWQPPEGAAVFSIAPDAGQQAVRILDVTAATEVSIDSVASVGVLVEARGTGNRDVTVAVSVDGVRRQEAAARLTGDQAQAAVPLTFVPSRLGLARVRVDASVAGSGTASAEVAIHVTNRVWRVLVFDGRPTYPSTFVRRALEADPRFAVIARSVTSRGAAVESGAPPVSLGNAAELAAFDLVVVGAPETLGSSEAAALNRYLRDRHGAVILLPEGIGGALVPGLTGVARWREDRRPAVVRIGTGDEAWTASEFVWPDPWPALATPLATPEDSAASRRTADVAPPVWQMPVGGGRLVVSSAIDGWRSRAGVSSGYSAFWRLTAATAANATPARVQVELGERLVIPGAPVAVSVQDFASASGAAPPALSARIVDVNGASTPARLWPGASTRLWRGMFRAPDVPGRYRFEVSTGGGASGVAEFVVDDADRLRTVSEGNGLAPLAAATHRGATMPASELGALPARIMQAVPPSQAPQRRHPMREVWWLVPFTLCAAGEWWLRRRRGER
jgi:hypothetical protein